MNRTESADLSLSTSGLIIDLFILKSIIKFIRFNMIK